MSKKEKDAAHGCTDVETASVTGAQGEDVAAVNNLRNAERVDARRWWIKLVVQPTLLLVCGVMLIIGLGIAQRFGFITAGGSGNESGAAGGEAVRYICPMMCTPPQGESGRCPVCAMELVPATAGGGEAGSQSIEIGTAARRVANIRTVSVQSAPTTRTFRAIGRLSYDESTLKTIAAYVDGRLERLHADYTGVVVQKDDPLALLYSPQLYTGQVELLTTRRALQSMQSSSPGAVESQRRLYTATRQRLLEMGITEPQIAELEAAGEANSRLQLRSPISGTVIERLAVEGQHVKIGQPIYRLADLSTVWLMLELFPEDAAAIRRGQQVEAEVQSYPGQIFAGHVTFIDPNVDPGTRTVGVRVALANDDGRLRIGDYARTAINVPLDGSRNQLVVPRNAVLMAGSHSVVYVETEPGRFELRQVVLGPSMGDQIFIRHGLQEGDQVATQGNFLIDSQMQLAGNPSLIDPTRAQPVVEIEIDPADLPPIGTPEMVELEMEIVQLDTPQPTTDESEEIAAALARLSPGDRALAEKQSTCPVADMPLGSMGTPISVEVNGRPIFICCEGCRKRLLAEPAKYLAKLPREAVR